MEGVAGNKILIFASNPYSVRFGRWSTRPTTAFAELLAAFNDIPTKAREWQFDQSETLQGMKIMIIYSFIHAHSNQIIHYFTPQKIIFISCLFKQH